MNRVRHYFRKLNIMQILNLIMLPIAILTLAATWNSLEKQTSALKHQSMDLKMNSYVEIKRMYFDIRSSLLTSSNENRKQGAMHRVAFLTEDLVNIIHNSEFDKTATSVAAQTIIRSLQSFNSLACEVYEVNIFEAIESSGFPKSAEFFAEQTWSPLMTITGEMPDGETATSLNSLVTCGRGR